MTINQIKPSRLTDEERHEVARHLMDYALLVGIRELRVTEKSFPASLHRLYELAEKLYPHQAPPCIVEFFGDDDG